MTRPRDLILGSTGVIGRVLCERLGKRGASLVLGGRDAEKLNELAEATGGKACFAKFRHGSIDGGALT